MKVDDRDLHRSLTAALIRIGVEGAQALFHALREMHPRFRWPASENLGEIGPECINAVPVLIDALRDEYQDEHHYTHDFACAALVKIGPRAVPALVALSEEKDFNIPKHAAETLGGIGPKAVDAIPALMKMLRDYDWYLHQYASSALSLIGSAAVPALIEALKDKNTSTRGSAAWALGRIGANANATVPALVEALKDDNDHVHQTVIKALCDIGPEAKAAVPALEKELNGRWHADAHGALRSILREDRC